MLMRSRLPQAPGLPRPKVQVGRRTLQVVASAFDVSVRPYTLRKGDTLDSIAKKRDLSVDEVVNMNPGLKPATVVEGSTILLPANKLSARDKEILSGVSTESYRIYPVRGGETLEDILSKRKISLDEFKALNPGVDTEKIKDHQLLKLPAGKFTVREREMLIGSKILPPEFFSAAKNPFVIGVGALLMVCGFVLAWQKFYKEDDLED